MNEVDFPNMEEKKEPLALSNSSGEVLKDSERQPCEVWTRVMGYFRPVSEFNIGKKSEYAERKCFSEKKTMNRIAPQT